jgi:hypothetical protein
VARRCVAEEERRRNISVSVSSWVLDEIEGLPNKSDFIQEALVEKLHTGSTSGISLIDRKRLRSEFIDLSEAIINRRHRLLRDVLDEYVVRVDSGIALVGEKIASREGEVAALKEVAAELKGVRTSLASEVSKLVSDSDSELFGRLVEYIGQAYENLDQEEV